MSNPAPGRPPIREILSGQVLQSSADGGMTDHDIADLLGLLSALEGLFTAADGYLRRIVGQA